MVQVRTLTPSVKRVIHIPDDLIGVQRYGTYAHVERPAEHQIGPAASQRMANRQPKIPERHKLDLPSMAKPTGLRTYDRTIGAFVKPPLPPLPEPVVPGPIISAYSDSKGSEYWLMDRLTGHRLRKVRAPTPARAQTFAADFARANGFKPGDCYAAAV